VSAGRIGLLALAIWPAIQIGLVRTHGVNPWKLAGWGMYAAPQLIPDTRLLVRGEPDGPLRELDWIGSDREERVTAFLRDRLALGRLAAPDRLALDLLDEDPDLHEIILVVIQPVMDPRAGTLKDEVTSYEYIR